MASVRPDHAPKRLLIGQLAALPVGLLFFALTNGHFGWGGLFIVVAYGSMAAVLVAAALVSAVAQRLAAVSYWVPFGGALVVAAVYDGVVLAMLVAAPDGFVRFGVPLFIGAGVGLIAAATARCVTSAPAP